MSASHPDLRHSVGRRIAECRRGLGLTQLDLAEKLNISLQYVQRVEAGRVNLTLDSLQKWGNAVGANPMGLLQPPRSSAPSRRGRPRRVISEAIRLVKRSPSTIPVYRFRPAAGAWSAWQDGGIAGWMDAPAGVRGRRGLFVVQIDGRSMEPLVPHGGWCLFSSPWTSPREGEVGIFVRATAGDPEDGGEFTLKEYAPIAVSGTVLGALKSRNPRYPSLTPRGDDSERAFAKLLKTLES